MVGRLEIGEYFSGLPYATNVHGGATYLLRISFVGPDVAEAGHAAEHRYPRRPCRLPPTACQATVYVGRMFGIRNARHGER